MCSSERKVQRSIPIVKDEDVCVDFTRVEFYQEEEKVEIWLWVKNRLSEPIYVSLKNVCINSRNVYADYALDELEDGKDGYLKMILNGRELKEVCSYLEFKKVEFKVEIDDAEVKPLLWSSKVEILLDMLCETHTINVEQ